MAVFYGWAVREPMSLDFQATLVLGQVAAAVLVTAILQDGRGYWLKGLILVSAYFLITGGVVMSSVIAAPITHPPPPPYAVPPPAPVALASFTTAVLDVVNGTDASATDQSAPTSL